MAECRKEVELESINVISDLIGTLGFPIWCCVMLFNKNDKMTDAINNNTIALTKITTKLGDVE